MKNKKRNTIITIVIVTILLLGGVIFFLLNYGTSDNGFSILEKKWITEHENKVVDVDVYNDIPIYGYNGCGIIFDYLSYLTKEYQIQFNKISYYTDSEQPKSELSFLALDSDEEISKYDILMNEDNYVLVSSKNNNSVTLDKIEKIAILKSDEVALKNYLNNDEKIVIYENIEQLMEALKNQEYSYALIPGVSYISEIFKNQFAIVDIISDLKKKFVLRVKDETVYDIMQKSYSTYLNQSYLEDYSKNYLNVYFDSTNTSDLDKKNYNAKTYKYGYIVNMPYENFVNEQFVGTLSNYLMDFEKKANVEIEAVRYTSIDEVKSALVSGEIDFALGNFNYDNINMNSMTTVAIKDLEYVVLSKNEYEVNSIKGFKNQVLSVVAGSSLYTLAKDSGVATKIYSNTDSLLRSMDDESIVLLDKETYLYYKDSKLKDYKIILEDKILDGYHFIMNASNATFNQLFDGYISMIDYQNVRYLYQTNIMLDKDYTIVKIIGFIIALLFFMVATVVFINRKNVTNTVISKEEKLKYIDPITSLKNRSYLNMNIYKWDDNVIFPQSVVVLDVNQLKEVNDTYGREAGDEIIKKVASILINRQLENTDIIRSGGDEFLIYMVGYEEKQVSEYAKKITKEMRDIPNCSGVEFGYSMILDEVKTVDDAINEAISMVTKNKEKRKAKE